MSIFFRINRWECKAHNFDCYLQALFFYKFSIVKPLKIIRSCWSTGDNELELDIVVPAPTVYNFQRSAAQVPYCHTLTEIIAPCPCSILNRIEYILNFDWLTLVSEDSYT